MAQLTSSQSFIIKSPDPQNTFRNNWYPKELWRKHDIIYSVLSLLMPPPFLPLAGARGSSDTAMTDFTWRICTRLVTDGFISLCNPRDRCTHSLLQDYCIVKLITESSSLFTHGHSFVAGNSIVRTRPQNHAWDHCGETSAYKTT